MSDTLSQRLVAGALMVLLAACAGTSDGRTKGGAVPTGEWEVTRAALAPLATPCTLDGSKTFTVTLRDGETALIGLDATKQSLLVNDVACVAGSAAKVSTIAALKVVATRASTDVLLGARVLLDFTAPFLAGTTTAAKISVDLGGAADELWVRTGALADKVELRPDPAMPTTGVVALKATTRDIEVRKAGRAAFFLGAGDDTFTSTVGIPVRVYGEAGDDTLTTGAGVDLLDGDEGNDKLSSGGGDDVLVGGLGGDLLNGQAGCDSYIGGDGVDTLKDDLEAVSWVDGVEINGALTAGLCTRDGGNESPCAIGYVRDETGLCVPQRSGDGSGWDNGTGGNGGGSGGGDSGGGGSSGGSTGSLGVNAGFDQYVNVGENVSLSGSVREDVVVMWWSQLAGPRVTLTNTDQRNTSFVAPDYTGLGHPKVVLVFQATDGSKVEADVVIVTLNHPPAAPTVTVSSAASTANPLTCTVTSSDVDGDTLVPSYAWTKNGIAAQTTAQVAKASLVMGDVWSCTGSVTDQHAMVSGRPMGVRVGCGNGTKDTNEVCDDGNAIDGDGCDNQCADVNECLGTPNCQANSTCVNTVGSYRCDCNAGYMGDGKVSACSAINCNAGQKWDGSACVACESGKWSPGGYVTTCDAIGCEKDQFWSSGFCFSCGPGKYSDGGNVSSCQDISCPTNQYFDMSASPRACKACPTGLVSSGGASTSCAAPGADCPQNTYWMPNSPTSLDGQCVACPDGTYSPGGAVSVCTAINCDINYRWDSRSSKCVSCPRGQTSYGGYVTACLVNPRWEARNYTVSPDGTVLDKVTMLQWQREPSAGAYTQTNAQGYCATLGAGWRLPTIEELLTTLDKNRTPMVDPAVFSSTVQKLWSSTVASGNGRSMDMNDGTTTDYQASVSNYARCVRPTCDSPASSGLACAAASCSAGTFWTGSGCSACPAGHATLGGRVTECKPILCPQFTKWNPTSQLCEACPADYSSPGGAVTYCSPISCSQDHYWDGSTCLPCPSGMSSAGGPYTRCGYYLPRTYQRDSVTTTPIVTDTRTGLQWQRVAPTTGGTWGGDGFTWADALAYCTSLNIDGATGFRLASRTELESILGTITKNEDPQAFPDAPRSLFWSSTPVAGSSSRSWFVSFSYGYADSYDVSANFRVRCVR
ncbi:MAG: hypothetical protein RL199_586 [Pseudomonadota bacterium]|jgi:cysteine-rich repeat protein